MPNKTRKETERNALAAKDDLSWVYYSRTPLGSEPWRFPHTLYAVASIAEVNLHEIFRVFNSLHRYSDARVVGLNEAVRSMSQGDVVVRPDGSVWVCLVNEWTKLRHAKVRRQST